MVNVNVGKYASPMEYMEITKKNSGIRSLAAKCDPFQRIMMGYHRRCANMDSWKSLPLSVRKKSRKFIKWQNGTKKNAKPDFWKPSTNYPIDFGEIESTNYLHDFSVQKASFSIVN